MTAAKQRNSSCITEVYPLSAIAFRKEGFFARFILTEKYLIFGTDDTLVVVQLGKEKMCVKVDVRYHGSSNMPHLSHGIINAHRAAMVAKGIEERRESLIKVLASVMEYCRKHEKDMEEQLRREGKEIEELSKISVNPYSSAIKSATEELRYSEARALNERETAVLFAKAVEADERNRLSSEIMNRESGERLREGLRGRERHPLLQLELRNN